MTNSWVRKEVIGDCRKRSDGSVAIYALCEPDGRPRYVGKTVYYLHVRHKAHIRAARRGGNLPVHRWLRKQERLRNGFAIHLLEYVSAGEDWAGRERHWIAKIRADQPDALNLCDGGEGTAGIKHSKERNERIAGALRKGRYCGCENCGASFWRKPKDQGQHNFCSRDCYQSWQVGRSKAGGPKMGAAGRAAAAKARKARTHCKRGHELNSENTYINPRGARVCKECRRDAKHAFCARNR